MYKRMLGETIYRLRKEKGLSQSELGEFVGVSNKAVSKWETYEANPDITLLPLLAQALGVTTDELLTDISPDKTGLKTEDAKFFGVEGTAINSQDEYEFISDKKSKKGLPFVHVHIGKNISAINAKARGIIAIGNNAKGIISIGLFSCGLISAGIFSLGLLSFGVFAIGLAAGGTIAAGGLAMGAIAVGIVSIGAVAVGFVSVGALAIGLYAHTGESGYAIGKYTFIHKMFTR